MPRAASRVEGYRGAPPRTGGESARPGVQIDRRFAGEGVNDRYDRPAMGFRRVRVFAVEDTTAQVCWAGLPAGKVVLEAGGIEVRVDADGRPGAALLEGLSPATRYRLTADGRVLAQ